MRRAIRRQVVVLFLASLTLGAQKPSTDTTALQYGAEVRIKRIRSDRWERGLIGRITGCLAVMVQSGSERRFEVLKTSDIDSLQVKHKAAPRWYHVAPAEFRKRIPDCRLG